MMFNQLNQLEWLFAVALISGLLALVYLFALFKAVKQLRLFKASTRFLFILVLLPISVICLGVLSGMQGYQVFTKEELIAHIIIQPVQKQQFKAELRSIKGDKHVYILEGDEIQIDAKVLKWHPFANFLGLHTHYQLDRISGRYQSISDARQKAPSVYSLNSQENWLDLVEWRIKHEGLSALLDAKYGSATFIAANRATTYDLYVTTSGLIVKESKH